jgi:transcriptional regulator with XRE-family HTH domain
MGVSQSSLSQYLKGNITEKNILLIAEALGVNVSDLYKNDKLFGIIVYDNKPFK